jgi:hypothetical protein
MSDITPAQIAEARQLLAGRARQAIGLYRLSRKRSECAEPQWAYAVLELFDMQDRHAEQNPKPTDTPQYSMLFVGVIFGIAIAFGFLVELTGLG